jgi:flagellar basal-body rod modification protein FlgD
MSVPAVGSTSSTNNAAPSVANDNGFKASDFMQLLMTQLKNQDPLSPMDPTQFSEQLVQFNSLDQLVAIRQDLDTQNTALNSTGSESSTSGSTGSNQQNSAVNGSN